MKGERKRFQKAHRVMNLCVTFLLAVANEKCRQIIKFHYEMLLFENVFFRPFHLFVFVPSRGRVYCLDLPERPKIINKLESDICVGNGMSIGNLSSHFRFTSPYLCEMRRIKCDFERKLFFFCYCCDRFCNDF